MGGDLKNYFEAVKAGQKPLSFGLRRPDEYLLFGDISYQIELGYCDLKKLSSLHGIDLLDILEPVISQWRRIGLVKLLDVCLYLTTAGEFWAVNLAQILISYLQEDR